MDFAPLVLPTSVKVSEVYSIGKHATALIEPLGTTTDSYLPTCFEWSSLIVVLQIQIHFFFLVFH